MSDGYAISTADRLLIRLAHAIRSGHKVTFLIGSGLTSPISNLEPGIPNANVMVERVRKSLETQKELRAFDDALNMAPERKKYQIAMQFMIECRGQSALNKLIREAVLEARLRPSEPLVTDVQLERDLAGWHLTPGIRALGQMMQEHESVFQQPILTSNFDPLIEISIRSAGRAAATINLPNDGSFRSLIVSDNMAQVVHFHGFWREGDTLHTPEQLTRNRPLLTGNLKKMLQETILVVIGYGGWDDVVTESLMNAVSEQSDGMDVLWTFFSDGAEVIQSHENLLTRFKRVSGNSIVTYSGVNCHDLLPKLQQQTQSSVIRIVGSNKLHRFGDISAKSSPPVIEAWVGRESEITTLLRAQNSVIALYGMGGFGKSALAARYLSERASRADVSFCCWADCREQGNTLQTHLVNMLEQITQGEIGPESLQKASTQDVVDLFFERLGESRCLFVFDNIDHYVDLETQKAVGIVDTVLERALMENHKCQFIFTSRPKLEYSSDRFVALPVSGLDSEEAEKLFVIRGAAWIPEHKERQLKTLLRLTQGSALHLNLIATQVAKRLSDLDDLLNRIEKGTAPEAEDRILSEIWGTLKDEHKEILRYLAELPHGEPEQWVGSCLNHFLNFNRFSKALKALKGLSLIVVKPAETGGANIELHPLVKTFIRNNFRKEEQAPIVEKILIFLDKMIGRFGGSKRVGPVSLLENWTGKIELCIEHNRPAEAMSTLYDVYETLELRGQVEEFLRLAELVINNYSIGEDPGELYKFDTICESFVDTLGQLGRYDEADFWLKKFAGTIAGKSARYIWFCHVKAYAFWIRGDPENAKKWAAEGVELKTKSQMDTKYDSGYNLALARRDSGEIEPALAYFLSGEVLEAILADRHFDKNKGGPFYGNIGRCLQMQGRFDDGLICLKKSARLLENEDYNRHVTINRGWAACWLAEILQKKRLCDLAYVAFRSAASKWKSCSPARARDASRQAEELVEKLTDNGLALAGDWEIEQIYLKWVRRG